MEENNKIVLRRKIIECYWPHHIEEINGTFLRHNSGYYLNKEELKDLLGKVSNALMYYDEVGVDKFNEEIKQEREEELKILREEYKELKNNPPPPKKKGKGFVYFMTDNTGLIKIGITKNINQRLRTMQVANPTIKIIRYIYSVDMEQTESELHKRFEDRRINGEWFKLNKEDLKYINSLKGDAK